MAEIDQDHGKDVQFGPAVDFDRRDPKAGLIAIISLVTVLVLLFSAAGFTGSIPSITSRLSSTNSPALPARN